MDGKNQRFRKKTNLFYFKPIWRLFMAYRNFNKLDF